MHASDRWCLGLIRRTSAGWPSKLDAAATEQCTHESLGAGYGNAGCLCLSRAEQASELQSTKKLGGASKEFDSVLTVRMSNVLKEHSQGNDHHSGNAICIGTAVDGRIIRWGLGGPSLDGRLLQSIDL